MSSRHAVDYMLANCGGRASDRTRAVRATSSFARVTSFQQQDLEPVAEGPSCRCRGSRATCLRLVRHRQIAAAVYDDARRVCDGVGPRFPTGVASDARCGRARNELDARSLRSGRVGGQERAYRDTAEARSLSVTGVRFRANSEFSSNCCVQRIELREPEPAVETSPYPSARGSPSARSVATATAMSTSLGPKG
jgi:hypothetical protein